MQFIVDEVTDDDNADDDNDSDDDNDDDVIDANGSAQPLRRALTRLVKADKSASSSSRAASLSRSTLKRVGDTTVRVLFATKTEASDRVFS